MNFGIIKKEISDHKLSLAIYCIASILLILLYTALFPSLQEQSQNFSKLLDTYPAALKEAFGIQGNAFATLESFLSVELFSLMWPLLAILLVTARAGNALAGEVERNTIGTLLAQPMSRTQLFLSKYASGVVTIIMFVAASILSIFPLALLYGVSTHAKNILVTGLLCTVFGLAIYGVALALSALTNERGKVYGPVGGVLSLMYVLNIVSGIRPQLHDLKYASVFNYFDAQKTLTTGHLNLWSMLVFVSIAVISVVAGIAIYNKRDISI